VTVPVLLIRHAHAGTRKEWQGDDRQRPLSPKGERQALALAKVLTDFAPARLLSSPYVRCVQTLQPYSDDHGLKVEEVEELAEGAGSDAVKLVRACWADRIAMCTHGDVVPEVLRALTQQDGLHLGRTRRPAKGSAWLLEAKRGKFVRATYLPPGG
jgi:8-oxo-dGTP diphosphatase